MTGTTSRQDEMQAIREALVGLLSRDPERWWTAAELREEVQNGWPASLVSSAVHDLISSRRTELNSKLHLRLLQ